MDDRVATSEAAERPYPGFRPFDRDDAEFFFGREPHVDSLLEVLDREHFLAITGPSGSGKSSLVRAGLLPMLPLRTIGGGRPWRYAVMRPGDRPINSLGRALLADTAFGNELRHGSPGDADFSEPMAVAELSRGPRGLVSLVADARKHIADLEERDCNLFLLVDQFEEIFTYAEAGARQSDEADAFVDLLLDAHQMRASGIYVALTMRSDFLGHCVRFLNLPDVINHSQYLTPRLSRDQLTAAITNPARMLGGDLDDDLAVELVNAVSNGPDQLPVLQHALARMWDRSVDIGNATPHLEIGDLVAVGGASHALARHADEILTQQLTPEQQCAAEWLFRAITEQRSPDSGGQIVRRPQSLARIAEWSGIEWTKFLPVLEKFADPKANFLTFATRVDPVSRAVVPADADQTVVDLSHEALMRQWTALKAWIACEREASRQFRDLLQRARDADKDDLLSGAALSRATDWMTKGLRATGSDLACAPAAPTRPWASRYLADDAPDRDNAYEIVTTFIGRSEKRARSARLRKRNIRSTFLGLICGAALLGGNSAWETVQASREETTRHLWDSFADANYSGRDNSAAWLHGLLDLSYASRGDRVRFIDAGFGDGLSLYTGGIMDTTVLQATVGIDDGLRASVLQKLQALTPQSDTTSKIPQPDPDRYAQAVSWLGGDVRGESFVRTLMHASSPASASSVGASIVASARGMTDAERRSLVREMGDALLSGQTNPFGGTSQALIAVAGSKDSVVRRVASQLVDSLRVTARDGERFGSSFRKMAGWSYQLIHLSNGLDDSTNAMLAAQIAKVAADLRPEISRPVPEYTRYFKTAHAGARWEDRVSLVADIVGGRRGPRAPGVAAALADAGRLGSMPPDAREAARLLPEFVAALREATGDSALATLSRAIRTIAPVADVRLVNEQTSQLVNLLTDWDYLVVLIADGDEERRASAVALAITALAPRVDARRSDELAMQILDGFAISRNETRDAFRQAYLAILPQVDAAGIERIMTQANHRLSSADADVATTAYHDRAGVVATLLAATAARIPQTSLDARVASVMSELTRDRTSAPRRPIRQGSGSVADSARARRPRHCALDVFSARGDDTALPITTADLAASRTLGILAGAVDDTRARTLVQRIMTTISATSDPVQMCVLGDALSVLTSRADPRTASALWKQFATWQQNTRGADTSSQAMVFADVNLQGLSGLLSALPPAQILSVLPSYLALLELQARRFPDDQPQQELFLAIARLDSTRVVPMLDAVGANLTMPNWEATTRFTLGLVATKLLDRTTLRDNARAARWIEACKNPFVDRVAVAAAVRRGFPDAPRESDGGWAFLRWGVKTFGIDAHALLPGNPHQ